jgi:caffeoyl-CoA O-methyltransferase
MLKNAETNIELHNSDNGRVALPIVPQILDDPLSSYALKMLYMRDAESPLDDVLREMEDLAALEQIPIIGPLEGAVVQVLTQLRQPASKMILDIGTAIGYSALWMARDLPEDSKIISIEIDPQRAQLAEEFIEKAGYQHKIKVILGDALEILPTLGQFDLIFQDVIKHVYFGSDSKLALKLFDHCMDHLVDGGTLLGDNAFCMGEVLHNQSNGIPAQIRGIQAYNKQVATHPDLSSVIIPVRDGLWVSHKHKRSAA